MNINLMYFQEQECLNTKDQIKKQKKNGEFLFLYLKIGL
jgi:hypothetical protein